MKCEICGEEIDKPAYWKGKTVCQECWRKENLNTHNHKRIGEFWKKWNKKLYSDS